jgi:hypothetical protein
MRWHSDAAEVAVTSAEEGGTSAEEASLAVLLAMALLATALGPAFAVIGSVPGSVLA